MFPTTHYTQHYHTNQTSEMVYVSLKRTMIQSLKTKQPLLIAYLADAKISKGFAQTITNHINGLQDYCYKSKAFVGSVIPFCDNDSNRFIYNLVTITNSLRNRL